jgi:hypothetical protein
MTVLAGRDATFVLAVNWSNAPRRYGGVVQLDNGATYDVAPFDVAARDAMLLPIAGAPASPPASQRRSTLPVARRAAETPPSPVACTTARVLLNRTQAVTLPLPDLSPGEARAVAGSALGAGDDTIVLANATSIAVIAPNGGARVIAFAHLAGCGDTLRGLTNATGALRDDVLVQPPPSTTDRIARYTHTYPAGTFNRPYRVEILDARGPVARVRFSYDAPDLPPHGAHFEKTITLAADAARLIVDESVTFSGDTAGTQRAVRDDALAVAPDVAFVTAPTFVAWNDGQALAVTWPADAVERITWTPYGSNGTLTAVASPGTHRTTYALSPAADRAAALAFAERERDWLAAHPN